MKVIALIYILSLVVCSTLFTACFHGEEPVITENHFDSLELANFVEPEFPFITIPLDARNLGKAFPDTNFVARGLTIQLGNSAYACFDMDLLRWSVAWTGDFIPMVLPAHVSYHDFFQKNSNELPTISGHPAVATGIYPGWSVGVLSFHDTRPAAQQVEGINWGPIPENLGRWQGVYVHGNRAVLTYRIGTTEVVEMPGATLTDNGTVFTRSLRVGPAQKELFLQIAEVTDGQAEQAGETYGYILQGNDRDSITAVGISGGGKGTVHAFQNRYLVIAVPPADTSREFTVAIWKGAASDRQSFEEQKDKYEDPIPSYGNGGARRWKTSVATQGQLSPDTAAFVTDVLTLPLPNPWARNFRVADLAFFGDGRAAVSTYEGDVWIVSGIDKKLNRLNWQRFASGLYEPMSIEVVNNQVFVYAKEGIVRLQDLNDDGEADYYENFSNLMNQSTGTREWAADMVADNAGNFYIAKGGHITGYKGILPLLTLRGKKTAFRASSAHSGTVMKISANGHEADIWAAGLRMPYIGLNRRTGVVSASDQQGNYVPATPIYYVNKGDYFGVPITAHQAEEHDISLPITWIPHRVDRSGISQTWIDSKSMGPLNGQMVHFSFGRPGIFRVLLDTLQHVWQGGVSLIDTYYPAPVMKGEINPHDGLLYVAGFNNFASNSTGISALTRLRYTGNPSYMVSGVYNNTQGIVLSFDSPLDKQRATDASSFKVKRWNYQRTQEYGSAHFRLDGGYGEEAMPVLASYLSKDGKNVLLVVQDHRKVDQVEIQYDLIAADGHRIQDGLWFTVNQVNTRDLTHWGLGGLSINIDSLASAYRQTAKPEIAASVAWGGTLFQQLGCRGCHAIDPDGNKGMYGPPLYGMVGRQREFLDGRRAVADDDYLRQSILTPSAKVVKGYTAEMPSFEGILSEADLTSLILYLNTL